MESHVGRHLDIPGDQPSLPRRGLTIDRRHFGKRAFGCGNTLKAGCHFDGSRAHRIELATGYKFGPFVARVNVDILILEASAARMEWIPGSRIPSGRIECQILIICRLQAGAWGQQDFREPPDHRGHLRLFRCQDARTCAGEPCHPTASRGVEEIRVIHVILMQLGKDGREMTTERVTGHVQFTAVGEEGL